MTFELRREAGGKAERGSCCAKQFGDPSKCEASSYHMTQQIPVLGINPKELKTEAQTDTGTPMFVAALLITAERWVQPRCPSTEV